MISTNRYRHFQIQGIRNHKRLHCKCNRNHRLLSRLNKVFGYLRCYIMPEIWFGIKAKDNNITYLPIDGVHTMIYQLTGSMKMK